MEPVDSTVTLINNDEQHIVNDEVQEDIDKDAVRGLPKVFVGDRPFAKSLAGAIAALHRTNNPRKVFRFAGGLARVRADEKGIYSVERFNPARMRSRLIRVADFIKMTKSGERPIAPPGDLIQTILMQEGWLFPPLKGLLETPTLRLDGTVLDTPGYDESSGLYLCPVDGLTVPDIPETPTREDAVRSVGVVQEVFADFPFDSEASRANAIGLLLTPAVRPAIDGPIPLASIDAPQAGTGKSLIADLLCMVHTGRPAAMIGGPNQNSETEIDKRITAMLVAGRRHITFDNCDGAFKSSALARALTARVWEGRRVGFSQMLRAPQEAVWVVTGNNVRPAGDLARRSYQIRLDARMVRPWERSGFLHPNLMEWVSKNRGKILGALLTMARAWFAAGQPTARNAVRLGSFERWVEIVSGILEFCGVDGFLDNRDDYMDNSDPDEAEFEQFLMVLADTFAGETFTVRDLLEPETWLRVQPFVPDSVRPGEAGNGLAKRMGQLLARYRGTRFGADGLHVVSVGRDGHTKVVRWGVRNSSDETAEEVGN